MKKIIFGLIIFICGCNDINLPHQTTPEGINVVVIDGCQYIRTTSYYGYKHYVHKGNCNNPIHVYNKR